MRIYFSGGSPIVETALKNPSIMLSYYVNVKKGKPDARTKKLLTLRRKARKQHAR
jgi:hypothetical protein